MHDSWPHVRPQSPGRPAEGRPDHDAQLRELRHRAGNDLQLIQSLLAMQARQARHAEARAILADTLNRIGVLVRARTRLAHDHELSLCGALDEVCEALGTAAALRGIGITRRFDCDPATLPQDSVTLLAMIANELATNAVKHAFADGGGGTVWIGTGLDGDRLVVSVDDDGAPFAPAAPAGLGLDLATRLARSIGATLIAPAAPGKRFEVRLVMG